MRWIQECWGSWPMSWQSGQICDNWKQANKVSFIKKDEKEDLGNSHFSPCEVYVANPPESCIQTCKGCSLKQQWTVSMSWPKASCTFYSETTDYAGNDGPVDVIYLDFNKAFSLIFQTFIVFRRYNLFNIQIYYMCWLQSDASAVMRANHIPHCVRSIKASRLREVVISSIWPLYEHMGDIMSGLGLTSTKRHWHTGRNQEGHQQNG